MQRPKTAILLILAFLASLFAPVRAAWACPDGTPCVADASRGYVCAAGQCATRKSCCRPAEPLRCKHGAYPAAPSPGSLPALQGPDHCRFSVSAPPVLVAVTEQGTQLLALAFEALPAAAVVELTASAAPPFWCSECTLGCRPPPLLSTGPSRAPPAA